MCKEKGSKNVTLRKAIECVVNAYLNDDLVKIKVYDSIGDDTDEIMLYDSNGKDMDIAINIMNLVNPDNHQSHKDMKIVNNVKKLKAENVTVLPAFTDDVIQDIASLVADNINKELLSTYNLHKEDSDNENLDNEYEEVISDESKFSENALDDTLNDYCDEYHVLFNKFVWALYFSSIIIPDVGDFDPNTNNSCNNKYDNNEYICINDELMNKLIDDLCDIKATKKEILTNFDRLGFLHHQKNKLTVIVKGTPMYALKTRHKVNI